MLTLSTTREFGGCALLLPIAIQSKPPFLGPVQINLRQPNGGRSNDSITLAMRTMMMMMMMMLLLKGE